MEVLTLSECIHTYSQDVPFIKHTSEQMGFMYVFMRLEVCIVISFKTVVFGM